jgi:hypothetical protein
MHRKSNKMALVLQNWGKKIYRENVPKICKTPEFYGGQMQSKKYLLTKMVTHILRTLAFVKRPEIFLVLKQ